MKRSILKAGMLDDRDQARPHELESRLQGDGRCEGRFLVHEVARRAVEPCAKVRRYVRFTRERQRPLVGSKTAEQRAGSTSLVDDQAADDDIGSRGQLVPSPTRGPRTAGG